MGKSKSKAMAKRSMLPATSTDDRAPAPGRANELVRQYALSPAHPEDVDEDSWLRRPEIPDAREILGAVGETEDNNESEAVDVPVNVIRGPWGSKEDYLRSHFELLREDVVAPLRDAVGEVRKSPGMNDSEVACIYDKVHVIGYTFSHQGPAARVVFSTARAGKKIVWEQTKRLLPGTLVAITSAADKFQSVCKVAVIAARPLGGVQANPPEVDVLFSDPLEVDIDPLQEWLMVEARSGYYEAVRHTLTGLQRLQGERFPLSNHLVGAQNKVGAPDYVQRSPYLDLSSLSTDESVAASLERVNVLQWAPQPLGTTLDPSQLEAIKRILTKRLAVVQGPPGTGKTHVSVTALRILLNAASEGDPPIVVASQTNHALDQILRHVSQFEENFIRLGARTLDEDVIKKRTLFEVRRLERLSPVTGSMRRPALMKLRRIEEHMARLLDPLRDQQEPFSGELLHTYGLLTDAQRNSLQRGAKDWVQADGPDRPSGAMAAWLGEELVEAQYRNKETHLDLEFEEEDLEFEQLREMEAEARSNDDEGTDCLLGQWIPIAQRYTARRRHGATSQAVERMSKTQNLWAVPPHLRGLVYLQFEKTVKETIRDNFRRYSRDYMRVARELRVGKWEQDSVILKNSKLIGMTTTGLSKYRPLIASLRPRVLLVEEAAETLEGLVTTGCVESLEHLILVGDHKQLRGHCSVSELEGEPFNLGVSMFERLVNNNVEFTTLKCQRRMIPEIRKNLMTIYDDLIDHPSVFSRPSVPGMGGVNSFFFAHFWPESRDEYFSCCNEREAHMIVAFYHHLIRNGVGSSHITVLTLYNGQRKLILKKLKYHPDLQGHIFNVRTVDSYQGEESGIILLSLVRSNPHNSIGFLSDEHRICVALSRAKLGFYLFGDAVMLCKTSRLWWAVVKTMAKEPRRVGFALPLQCVSHQHRTWIKEPEDWAGLTGGCHSKCGGRFSCGHVCNLKCHPIPHERMACRLKCPKTLSCGHPCRLLCSQPCSCDCKQWTETSKAVRVATGASSRPVVKAKRTRPDARGAAAKGKKAVAPGRSSDDKDDVLIDLSVPDEDASENNTSAGSGSANKPADQTNTKKKGAASLGVPKGKARNRWTDVVSWSAKDGVTRDPNVDPTPAESRAPPSSLLD